MTKERNCVWDDLESYLRTIEIYLKGEHCHEIDETQKEEDHKLYMESIRLQKELKDYGKERELKPSGIGIVVDKSKATKTFPMNTRPFPKGSGLNPDERNK